MKYWFVMLMIAMSLMGCANTKTQTVTVVKNVYVEVPSEFTVPCTATAPPSAQEYDQSTAYDKEYRLVMYSSALLRDIALCNNQIIKIGQWSKEQLSVFSQSKEVKDDYVHQSDSAKR